MIWTRYMRRAIPLVCIALVISALGPSPALADDSETIGLSITRGDDAKVKLTARRIGWGVSYHLRIKDDEDDDDRYCVKGKVRLIVTKGFDRTESLVNCGGDESVVVTDGELRAPRRGQAITRIRLTLCMIPKRQPSGALCNSVEAELPQMNDHGTDDQISVVTGLLNGPMDAFLEHKAAKDPAYLEWDDDGCSLPRWVPYTARFDKACKRHDFGYRNFGQDMDISPNDSRREMVDQQFLADMLNICNNAFSGLKKLACEASAKAAFRIVRNFGGPFFYDSPAPKAGRVTSRAAQA